MNDRDSVTRRRSSLQNMDALLPVFTVAMLALVAAAPALAQTTARADGEAIYRERCVGCHETGAARAPDLAALRRMSPDRVLTALRSGSMSTQGQGLSNEQLDSLSRFVVLCFGIWLHAADSLVTATIAPVSYTHLTLPTILRV